MYIFLSWFLGSTTSDKHSFWTTRVVEAPAEIPQLQPAFSKTIHYYSNLCLMFRIKKFFMNKTTSAYSQLHKQHSSLFRNFICWVQLNHGNHCVGFLFRTKIEAEIGICKSWHLALVESYGLEGMKSTNHQWHWWRGCWVVGSFWQCKYLGGMFVNLFVDFLFSCFQQSCLNLDERQFCRVS